MSHPQPPHGRVTLSNRPRPTLQTSPVCASLPPHPSPQPRFVPNPTTSLPLTTSIWHSPTRLRHTLTTYATQSRPTPQVPPTRPTTLQLPTFPAIPLIPVRAYMRLDCLRSPNPSNSVTWPYFLKYSKYPTTPVTHQMLHFAHSVTGYTKREVSVQKRNSEHQQALKMDDNGD
ncbi:hypothetical protein AB1N83_013804 [Pleurotus pulmonarius]